MTSRAQRVHVHAYRPIDRPWRREKTVVRVRLVKRWRGNTVIGQKRVSTKDCVKVGPLLQTLYCAKCGNRLEVEVKPVCR